MATFGLARGIPVVAAATMAGSLAAFGHTRPLTLWVKRIGAALMFVAALYFFYEGGVYARWLKA